MLTLIVEDGTGVQNANTYLTVAEAETILDNLGYSFDAALSEDQKEQFLIRSASYLESFWNQYQGNKNSCDQGLQWPRYGACIYNCAVANDVVPDQIKQAQALGTYYESNSQSLQPITSGQTVKMKEIAGAVKKEYFDNGSVDGVTQFRDIQNLLKPTFKFGGAIRVIRV